MIHAFCAPGKAATTAFMLAMNGELVHKIKEHPYLAGTDNVILVDTDNPWFASDDLIDPSGQWADGCWIGNDPGTGETK